MFYVLLCMFMTWWFLMIFMYILHLFYIYIFLYKILTVFDRCAYRGLSFWVRFYNIIIHYIILYILYYPMLSLAHFRGRCMWDFCGMCISVWRQISHFHQITHMSAVFMCFVPHISDILAHFVHFWCFDGTIYMYVFMCLHFLQGLLRHSIYY